MQKEFDKMLWSAKAGIHACRWRYLSNREKWVFGRVACMGRDVYSLLELKPKLFNVQKGRVDYLVDVINDPSLRAKAGKIAPHMARKDIIPMLVQEEICGQYPKTRPEFIYMDSYSELTDQLFIHKKDGWKFCCNYSDIDHGKQFNNVFENTGLLKKEDLGSEYERYFKYIRSMFIDTAIVFLHFPVKFDKREKFHLRYDVILKEINRMSTLFPPFYSITADEASVDKPENVPEELRDFPYHYNKKTYENLADKVRSLGILR